MVVSWLLKRVVSSFFRFGVYLRGAVSDTGRGGGGRGKGGDAWGGNLK